MANPYQKGVDSIAALMYDPSEENIKASVDEFVKLTDKTGMSISAITLRADWLRYKDDKLAGVNMSGRLNEFIKRFMENLDAFKSSVMPGHGASNQDKIYNLLCKLDFSHQTDYFKSLMNSEKRFVSFVIRGPQAGYGQRWLANKLIQGLRNEEEPLHEPLGLDFLELNLKFDSFIEHLAKALGIAYQQSMSVDARRIKLKNELVRRIDTASQFIILINSFSFIHSEEYADFIRMIKYFSEEINNAGLPHKCIFLFVEEHSSDRYAHTGDCIFSEDSEDWQARMIEEFRFVDLGVTRPIGPRDISKWLPQCSDEQMKCFQAQVKAACEMEKFLGSGHPQEVIALVCQQIGVNYIENEKIWIKY